MAFCLMVLVELIAAFMTFCDENKFLAFLSETKRGSFFPLRHTYRMIDRYTLWLICEVCRQSISDLDGWYVYIVVDIMNHMIIYPI